MGSQQNRRKGRFNRIRGPNVTPVFSGEIIKGQQSIFIFFQALGRFGIFCFVRLHKIIKVAIGFILVVCLPYLMQFGLRFGLQALGQTVEDIRGLVNPASLPAGGVVDFAQRFPERQSTVANCQLRSGGQSSGFQILQQLFPRKIAFAETALNGH